MKNLKKLLLLMFMPVLGAMLATTPASAQSKRLAVNIPFDFVVGKVAFKAGTYRIAKQPESSFLSLNSAEGQSIYTLPVPGGNAANRNGEPYLVFARYGGEAFLEKVVFSVTDNYDLPRSSREKELMSKLMPREQPAVLIQGGQE